jgi:GNAT superfamily N-acetyltransferase
LPSTNGLALKSARLGLTASKHLEKTMRIRPFDYSDRDYEKMNDIWNAAFPEYKSTPDEIKARDKTQPAHIVLKRYMLELGGRPIAYGVFFNDESAFHPQKFSISPVVLPAYLGCGYGKAVFEHLLKELEPYNPIELSTFSREDFVPRNRFFAERGFVEKMRSFESRLDVAAFDPSPYQGLEEVLAREGILLKSYAELADDPERQQKIYDLHTTIDLDVPRTGEYSKPSFERFAEFHWGDEHFVPETFLLAVKEGAYIGMSELSRSPADARLHTGLTGVLREYRRQGIALALKVKGIQLAKAMAVAEINTWNESNNQGMLAINEKLGFVKQPAAMVLVKTLE